MADTVGDRIKKGRERAGVGQRELARRAGIAQPYLSRIEAGDQEPSLGTLRAIAAVLGCDYKDLLP